MRSNIPSGPSGHPTCLRSVAARLLPARRAGLLVGARGHRRGGQRGQGQNRGQGQRGGQNRSARGGGQAAPSGSMADALRKAGFGK